jgi:serine/threonine protein kinase
VDYVIKVLQGSVESDAVVVEQFRREALVGMTVVHPNLVTVLSAQVQTAPYYLVMPRLEGATVETVLAGVGPLSIPRSLWLARQVAEALECLHTAGWVHGDVKPENVLLSPSGHATLLDLGLAVPQGACDACLFSRLQGTLAYAAPELFTSTRSISPASDVYSLGAALYQMLTGRTPFVAADPAELVEQHRRGLPPEPRNYVPHLPRTVSRLVERMLAKEPIRRPASRGELAEELARAEIECFGIRG